MRHPYYTQKKQIVQCFFEDCLMIFKRHSCPNRNKEAFRLFCYKKMKCLSYSLFHRCDCVSATDELSYRFYFCQNNKRDSVVFPIGESLLSSRHVTLCGNCSCTILCIYSVNQKSLENKTRNHTPKQQNIGVNITPMFLFVI